jgi:hypothetical protein
VFTAGFGRQLALQLSSGPAIAPKPEQRPPPDRAPAAAPGPRSYSRSTAGERTKSKISCPILRRSRGFSDFPRLLLKNKISDFAQSLRFRFGISDIVSESQTAFRNLRPRFGISDIVSESQTSFRNFGRLTGSGTFVSEFRGPYPRDGRRAGASHKHVAFGGKPRGSGISRLDHQARGRLKGNPGCAGVLKLLTLACPSKYPSSDREVSFASSSSLACSVPGCAPRAVSFVASCVLLFESCVRAVACGGGLASCVARCACCILPSSLHDRFMLLACRTGAYADAPQVPNLRTSARAQTHADTQSTSVVIATPITIAT